MDGYTVGDALYGARDLDNGTCTTTIGDIRNSSRTLTSKTRGIFLKGSTVLRGGLVDKETTGARFLFFYTRGRTKYNFKGSGYERGLFLSTSFVFGGVNGYSGGVGVYFFAIYSGTFETIRRPFIAIGRDLYLHTLDVDTYAQLHGDRYTRRLTQDGQLWRLLLLLFHTMDGGKVTTGQNIYKGSGTNNNADLYGLLGARGVDRKVATLTTMFL